MSKNTKTPGDFSPRVIVFVLDTQMDGQKQVLNMIGL